MAHLDDQCSFYKRSIAHVWPKPGVSTCLCPKCGDSLQLDLQALRCDEILHRVRSAYSPDALERAAYSKLLNDAQRDWDRCQSELRRLRDLLEELKTQQDALEAYMAGVRSVMSPIHSLPVELLGEIFKYICGDIGANCILGDRKPRLPTITLSRVCISWYNLVTSMPVLWSSFGSRDLDCSSTPSLFNLFLERSRPHLIDFEIEDYHSLSSTDGLSFLTASESSNRWRHVRIAASGSFATEMLQSLNNGRGGLPGLASLSLCSFTNTKSLFPASCPNLRSLTLSKVLLNLEYPRPSITHLHLRAMTPKMASRVIQHCPNVQVLEMTLLVRQDHFPLPNISCSVPKVFVDFDEAYGAATGGQQYLKCLTFPELTHLEILDSHPYCINTYRVELLCLMLERNRSHLTHLTIRAIVFTAEEVLQFFLCVPSVTTLEVEDAKILHRRTGVYLVLKSLIAPLQQLHQAEDCDEGNELENLGDDGDDSEDEENLDKGEKEMNVEIPSGKCLLPRLSDLRLVIRPRNRLLLELVHSRWKPFSRAMGSSSRDSDEVCVCLQKLSVRYPGKAGERARKRLEVLQENLVKFKEDGMGVEVNLS